MLHSTPPSFMAVTLQGKNYLHFVEKEVRPNEVKSVLQTTPGWEIAAAPPRTSSSL